VLASGFEPLAVTNSSGVSRCLEGYLT
jgi:hypothetical protein